MSLLLKHCSRCYPSQRVQLFEATFLQRLQEQDWDEVRAYTAGLRHECPAGIFACDFLLLPVLEERSMHWWLLVVCHPRAAASNPRWGGDAVRRRSRAQVVALDPEMESGVSLQAEAAARRRLWTMELVKRYLSKEWVASPCPDVGPFDVSSIASVQMEVPQSAERSDSGVYVLEFVRSLLRELSVLEVMGEGGLARISIRDEPRRRWQDLGARILRAGSAPPAKPSWECGPRDLKRLRACKSPAKPAPISGGCVSSGTHGEDASRGTSASALPKCAKPHYPPPRPQQQGALEVVSGCGAKFCQRSAEEKPGAKAGSHVPPRLAFVVLWFSRKAQCRTSVAQMRRLRQLGARVSEDGVDATHLVMVGALRRTLRVMCAICRGQEIVDVDWLKASLDAGQWVSEQSYVPAQLSWCPLVVALQRARDLPLLDGWAVFLLRSVENRSELPALVAAAGGQLRPGQPQQHECVAKRVLLLGTTADGTVAGAPVCSPEQLFEACMVQRLSVLGAGDVS